MVRKHRNESSASSMVSTKLLKVILVSLCLVCEGVFSQFYVKTHKSIPRIGRRQDPSLSAFNPNLKKLAEVTSFLTNYFDYNGDGYISDEESRRMEYFRNYRRNRMMEISDDQQEPPEYRKRFNFGSEYGTD